ncbi:MAG: GNAT family N-acetyltransferase [Halobacteriota archaeon]
MNIRIIKTLQELETVQTYWESWQNHANNDFDQFRLVCQLRPAIVSPYVLLIERNNQPHALLAGRLERTQFAPSIGYLSPVRVPVKVITVIHQGVLGHWDEETAKESVHYLWSLLGSGVADAIEFHYLSEHSILLKAIQVYSSPWFCEQKLRWNIHWEMNIPTEEKFIEHKVRSKHRSGIRKMQRELESAFPGKVSWRWMSSFDDVPGLCARVDELAVRTYQRGLGTGFVDDEEYRQRFDLFARREQLRVQLLEIDGKVRAFWFGYLYQGIFHASETGYDPDLSRYQSGTQIFIRMVDELAREGIRKLDFGLGDAPYKQRFGDKSWRETTIWLFAPTVKGLVLRSMLRLSIIIDSTARRILQRVGLVDKLKTLWRRRVAKGGN